MDFVYPHAGYHVCSLGPHRSAEGVGKAMYGSAPTNFCCTTCLKGSPGVIQGDTQMHRMAPSSPITGIKNSDILLDTGGEMGPGGTQHLLGELEEGNHKELHTSAVLSSVWGEMWWVRLGLSHL